MEVTEEKDEKEEERSCLVLFGSQTGTGVDLCNRLEFELRRRRYAVTMQSLNDFYLENEDLLASLCAPYVVVFVVSTTGNGECPDNMRQFWRKFLLRRSLPLDCLSALTFALFGLGDSSYFPLFNTAARRLHQRLLQLGATALPECGRLLADALSAKGIDGAFDEWSASLLCKLLYDGCVDSVALKFKVSLSDAIIIDSPLCSHRSDDCVQATVLSNERMTATEHFQDVRLLRVAVDAKAVSAKAGDVLSLRICNPLSAVQSVCALLGLEVADARKRLVTVQPSAGGCHTTLSVFALFRHRLAVCEPVTQFFFRPLAALCTDDMFRQKCVELSTDQMLFYDYCQSESRSYLEVLVDFKSALPSLFDSLPHCLSFLLSFVPPLKARQYSLCAIDSGSVVLSVCAALLQWRTPLRRTKTGLASAFIRDECEAGARICVAVDKGSFQLPKDCEQRRVLCIGTGTGIAPMHCLAKERMRKKRNGQSVAPMLVFAGNRYPHMDFLFESDWKQLVSETVVAEVITAFSRPKDSGAYVQRRVRQSAAKVREFLSSPKSIVLLAGRSGDMPREVRQALVQVMGAECIKQMERTRRYQTETWAI